MNTPRRFIDSAGRPWVIVVNVPGIRRVQTMVGLDLVAAVTGRTKDLADPVKLVDVVYVLCKPQADAAGVTDEQFGEAMAGDAIDHACDALIQATCDFLPARKGGPLRGAFARICEADAVITERMAGTLAGFTTEQIVEAMTAGLEPSAGAGQ